MTEVAGLHPHGHEFERFLHASVGEDRNGYAVTVLSTLARLGLDPWKEAAELAALGQEAARTRLGALLSGFRDVPMLARDHEAVAHELTCLLPGRPSHHASNPAGSSRAAGPRISTGTILAILMVLMIVAQFLFTGTAGEGE